MSSDAPLRVAYVGPIMDMVMEAYRAAHDRLGHVVQHFESPARLAAHSLTWDIVVCNPLAKTRPGGIEGACAIHTIVPETTLIVCLFTRVGHSHAMFVKHAMDGRCHPRMLLHYPRPSVSIDDVTKKMDEMARRLGGGDEIQSVAALPDSLLPFMNVDRDIGQIMAEHTGLARLVFTAATYRRWSTFGDLATQLHLSEGTVKNLKLDLKKKLNSAGIFPRDLKWTIGQFVRFVGEYQAFILAYGHRHLDLDMPEEPNTGSASSW